jgi:hypothetical protein
MARAEHASLLRRASAALALLICTVVFAGPLASPARALPPVPNPCQLPIVGNVCDVVGGVAGTVAGAAGDFVMRGVTVWVTDAAVWVTGKVGELIDKTASPDLTAGWFEGQYGTMVEVAGALALLMLMLAVIQALIRQDVGLLVRCAFGYLPMAFILAGVAVAATGLLVAVTDDMARGVVSGLGTAQSTNLLQAVGDAYKHALDQTSGIPLFGVFVGAIILALGAFVLWLELIIRDAAIYVCVFFLPLTFVAMIWPATSRWARRLVELLVAIVLAKFVIVAILSLASAALANTTLTQGDGDTFERMLAGAALLVLAAWSPFALLRLIPMMEVAAATVVSQRATISNATGAAGIQTPAAYMRQAMDRHSRPSTFSDSRGGLATASVGGTPGSDAEAGSAAGPASGRSQADRAAGRATYAPRSSPADAPPGSDNVVRTERGRPSPQPPPQSEPPRSAPSDHTRQARAPRPPEEE